MRRRLAALVIGAVLCGLSPVAAAAAASKSDDTIRLEGVVEEVLGDGFRLDVAGSTWRVLVGPDTEWDGPSGLGDLASGDALRVEGVADGDQLQAIRIRWWDDGGGSDGGSGGLRYESHDWLRELIAPDRFRLADGRVYAVDGATRWKDGLASYGDLAIGQLIEVYAERTGGAVDRALEVELEGHYDDEGELAGTITDLLAAGFVLDGATTVLVTATTGYDGDADRFEDLVVGWRVEAETCVDLTGARVALQVRADTDRPTTVDGEEFEPRQALVVPAPGADPSVIAARHGATLLGSVDGLAVLLEWPDELDNALLAAVGNDPEVAAVEPNYRFRDPESVRRRYVIVDRSLAESDFASQAAVVGTDLPSAQRRASGRGIVVALLDTGIDPGHPELAGRVLAGGLDLVDGDLEPWETRDGLDQDGDGEVDEAAGHGTFVASIVALGAPAAALVPYRVLDDDGGGTAYALALALADAIARDVDVINLSLVYHRRSTAVDLLLERAGAAGIVVVASAGNDAAVELPFPAADRNVVAVTALAADGTALAGFANRSQSSWLAAPGEDVVGAVDGGGFGRSSGTSMAAPFATATAALLLDADPYLDPALVAAALRQGGAPMVDGLWQGVALDAGAAVALVGCRLLTDPRVEAAAR